MSPHDPKIEGSVAFVTGASRGIGAATARALAERGASIGLLARTIDDLERIRSDLPTPSAAAAVNVTDAAGVTAAIDQLVTDLGPPDILVNNAGAGAYGPMLEQDPETYERLMRLNYLGTVHVTLAVLEGMAKRRRGHIVNVASVAGHLGAPFEAAYSASKFAVVGLSESMAAELAPFGVCVSLVSPGPVRTSFTAARGVPFQRRYPRPKAPEHIAAAVVRAVETGRFEQILPRWLKTGTIARSVAPGLYHRGLLRDAGHEANEARDRFEEAHR